MLVLAGDVLLQSVDDLKKKVHLQQVAHSGSENEANEEVL